jgi:hypothetical protein
MITNFFIYFDHIIKGKRNRNKIGNSSEDETNATKRLKPGIH